MELRHQLQAALGDAYTLGDELGGGGMSRVFVADDVTLGRTVVIKVLPPELADSVNAERFRREIHVAARLQQPFIVPLLSAGGSGDLVYYTMPKVDGESLHARLARDKQLPITDVVRILRDVLTALAYAHEHGVVHRDIKPANVFLSGQHAVVSDFGIARALGAAAEGASLTASGMAIGTPAYMAPEQASGGPAIDHRADLYAVGVMAYEMLAGVPPFTGASVAHLIARQIREAPEPLTHHRPSAPPELAQLVQRLLEKSPADRPQSADEVLRALDEVPSTPMKGVTAGGAGPQAPRVVRTATRSRGPILYGAIALLLVIAGIFAYVRRRDMGAPGMTAHASAGGSARSESSIAVMPLANESSDKDNGYFADGLTDELIKTLGGLHGVTVISRSSVFALRDRGLDARQIGDTLGVSSVLEGAVQRAGKKLRITVHLVRTSDRSTLWSDSYSGDVGDAFALQDSIARTVATTLRPKLSAAESNSRGERATKSDEAYDLYLRGLELFNARKDLRRSVEYFNEALARDTMFAEAHAGLALASLRLSEESEFGKRVFFDRAKAEAETAISLKEATPEAHAALAQYYEVWARDFETSERHLLRAIKLRPGYAAAHDWYSLNLAFRGRMDEALRENARARELDPFSIIVLNHAFWIAMLAHQYDAATGYGHQALDMEGDSDAFVHAWLGDVYGLQGKYSEAIAEQRRSIALRGADTLDRTGFAIALARAGRQAEARKIADAMQIPASQGKTSRLGVTTVQLAWGLAALHVALGDTDKALYWLDRQIESRNPDVLALATEPAFDALHSNPRFIAMVRRLGLTPVR